MDALPLPRRAYYAYLSRMYAFTHTLSHRSFLGIRLRLYARWLPILALLIGWLSGWPLPVLIGLLLVILWINYSMWRARRDNYNRFVAQGSALTAAATGDPAPPNQKIAVMATGLFSVSGRDNRLLLRPAQYWRVPLGDHVVMVEEEPGKFLYQFFNAASLQDVRDGLLLFGSQPRQTLAITFLASWGAEYTRFGPMGEVAGEEAPAPKRVTVLLSTADEQARRLIRDTIITDARRARLDARPSSSARPGLPGT